MRTLACLLCAALLVPPGLRAEDPAPELPDASPASAEAARIRLNDHWERVAKEYGQGDIYKVPAEKLFDPAVLDGFKPYERTMINGRARNALMKAVEDRQVEHPFWTEYRDLMKSQTGEVGKMMRENPALRQLLWDTTRPGGEAQLKRLLDDFAAARGAKAGLTLQDFLKGLDNGAIVKVLAGDKVSEGDKEKGKEKGKEKEWFLLVGAPKGAADQARKSAGSDVMASVGFDGAQAYGVFGDRHVYKDKSGNVVSLSVSSRRMPDGTLEDVVHVVNITNPSTPRGVTYSLRTDIDKLAAGIPVALNGLSLTLSVKGSGDDHAVSLGAGFANAKGEPPMSLSQMYAYRAARVFNYGRVVDVGGKEYYVSPETYTQVEGQGDAQRAVGYGQLSYWPKEQLDKLFAKSGSRDEVDPQTFDFRSIDLKGSKFGNVRDLRPDLIATVIRREGAQDVALPRASMGQDQNGQWWDVVLKDGQYVVQKGQPPASPQTPDSQTPPGQVRADGWPQLSAYTPDTPEAQRLNGLLRSERVKVYEATGATEFDKKFIIMFDKDFKSIIHPQFVGQGTNQFTQVLGLDVVAPGVIAARGNLGVRYMDLGASGFKNGAPDLKEAGIWEPEKGFHDVTNAGALKHALGLAGYADADADTILKRLAEQAAAAGASRWIAGGGPSGGKLPVGAVFAGADGRTTGMKLWPEMGPLAAVDSSMAPAGTGVMLDAASLQGVTHDGFPPTVASGDKKLSYVAGKSGDGDGAAVYRAPNGAGYLVFTIKPKDGASSRYTVSIPDFDASKGLPVDKAFLSGITLDEALPPSSDIKFQPGKDGAFTTVEVLVRGKVRGTVARYKSG